MRNYKPDVISFGHDIEGSWFLVEAAHALARRYPYLGNSRYQYDITGRRIEELSERLPASVVQAAQERGRARDLHTSAVEMAAEFGRMGGAKK